MGCRDRGDDPMERGRERVLYGDTERWSARLDRHSVGSGGARRRRSLRRSAGRPGTRIFPVPPNPEAIAGNLHFDEAEDWNIGSQMDVFSVALHELGQPLGLDHSNVPGAVMEAIYGGPWTDLHPDDIAGARSIYSSILGKWNMDWMGPENNVAGDIEASHHADNIFHRGYDNRMYLFWWDGNSWENDWMGPQNNVAGDIMSGGISNQVWYRGTDHRTYMSWWSQSTTSWNNDWLGSPNNNYGGSMSPSHLSGQTYFKGPDNRMYLWWWGGECN